MAGRLTKSRAKNILLRGEIKGKPLSEKQRNFFQLIADGKIEMPKPKKKVP